MTDLTSELTGSSTKQAHVEFPGASLDLQEITRRMTGTEIPPAGVDGRIGRHVDGHDRIERRRELREIAEVQGPYERT